MKQILLCILPGIFLLLGLAGCRGGPTEGFACITNNDCPPFPCMCGGGQIARAICSREGDADIDDATCGGTCDRETDCPDGMSCQFELREDRVGDDLLIYSCQPLGAGGGGGGGGSGGAAGMGGSGGSGGTGGSGGMSCATENALVNGGFENGDDSSTELLPSTFGQWVGDQRMVVSMGDDGITPVGGSGVMLEFVAATPDGPSAISNSSEVRQAVNLSACKGSNIQVEGKAQFNRIEGDAETAKTFTLFLWAFDGPLSELPSKYKQVPGELAAENKQVMVEEVGWEEVSVTMDVPAETDYVLFELIVNELVPKDNMEFDGQFADAASLTVTVSSVP